MVWWGHGNPAREPAVEALRLARCALPGLHTGPAGRGSAGTDDQTSDRLTRARMIVRGLCCGRPQPASTRAPGCASRGPYPLMHACLSACPVPWAVGRLFRNLGPPHQVDSGNRKGPSHALASVYIRLPDCHKFPFIHQKGKRKTDAHSRGAPVLLRSLHCFIFHFCAVARFMTNVFSW